MEKKQYGKTVLFAEKGILRETTTPRSYVRYVHTEHDGDILLMDGEVQLSTLDEYWYHEMLVHPVMNSLPAYHKLDILIVGGGDGCAAREVFKWMNVSTVTVVDYDKTFVEEFGKGVLSGLNRHSLTRENCTYVSADIRSFMQENTSKYDAIIVDLPDPEDTFVSLYIDVILGSKHMLKKGGAISMHVGPAMLDPQHPNWATIADFKHTLLHTFTGREVTVDVGTVYVPSFSNLWAFLWMRPTDWSVCTRASELVSSKCRYWKPNVTDRLDQDIAAIVRLDQQAL